MMWEKHGHTQAVLRQGDRLWCIYRIAPHQGYRIAVNAKDTVFTAHSMATAKKVVEWLVREVL